MGSTAERHGSLATISYSHCGGHIHSDHTKIHRNGKIGGEGCHLWLDCFYFFLDCGNSSVAAAGCPPALACRPQPGQYAEGGPRTAACRIVINSVIKGRVRASICNCLGSGGVGLSKHSTNYKKCVKTSHLPLSKSKPDIFYLQPLEHM